MTLTLIFTESVADYNLHLQYRAFDSHRLDRLDRLLFVLVFISILHCLHLHSPLSSFCFTATSSYSLFVVCFIIVFH
jgi:hypothetical protein